MIQRTINKTHISQTLQENDDRVISVNYLHSNGAICCLLLFVGKGREAGGRASEFNFRFPTENRI